MAAHIVYTLIWWHKDSLFLLEWQNFKMTFRNLIVLFVKMFENDEHLWRLDGFKKRYELQIKRTMDKTWRKVAAIVLIALLFWWLFWAIMADEEENIMEIPETEIVEWKNGGGGWTILFRRCSYINCHIVRVNNQQKIEP